MFTLINLESQETLESRITFEDGKRASRAARLLTLKVGRRFQVRKIELKTETESNWQDREKSRFDFGEYKPLQKRLQALSFDNFPLHFAHIAKKKPSLIAYTKDDLKAAADKQSLISIQGYVKLLIDAGAIQETEAQEIISAQFAHASALESELKFAYSEDDIEAVYTNYDENARSVGVSCMRYYEEHWARVEGNYYHPVRVYGAGDLAVAYLTNDDGQTIARALCWPEKKLYSRVYADTDILHNLLQAAGYNKSRYYSHEYKSIDGARLLRVINDNDNLVCPYLDESGHITDMTDYLIIDRTGFNAQKTEGEVPLRGEFTCDSCNDNFDTDEDFREVYTNASRTRSQNWCGYCRNGYSFYCQGTQEYYSETVDHTFVDEECYLSIYVERNANYCEYYEQYSFDDLHTVIIDDEGNTQLWSYGALEMHSYEYNNKIYANEVEHTKVVVERAKTVNNKYRAICWYYDLVEMVPNFIIDEDEIEIFEHDGKKYLKGYLDHYPVTRERFDIAPETANAHEHYAIAAE